MSSIVETCKSKSKRDEEIQHGGSKQNGQHSKVPAVNGVSKLGIKAHEEKTCTLPRKGFTALFRNSQGRFVRHSSLALVDPSSLIKRRVGNKLDTKEHNFNKRKKTNEEENKVKQLNFHKKKQTEEERAREDRSKLKVARSRRLLRSGTRGIVSCSHVKLKQQTNVNQKKKAKHTVIRKSRSRSKCTF